MEKNIKDLLGLTLVKTEIVDGDLHLHTLESGVGVFKAYGDCCAHAYVESINESAVLPAKILGWEHKSHRSENDKYGESLDYDFYTMKTESGYIDVELRTSHNGYYSGALEWAGFVPAPVDFS